MKAYLIDPGEQVVREIEVDDGLDSVYEAIDATLFDTVRLPNNDVIYVDDEGLSTKSDYFMIEGCASPLAGKGLVLGTDCEGYSTEPLHTFSAINDMVKFVSFDEALELARALDEEGRKREREYETSGVGFVYIPIAGILESAKYTEESN